MNKKRVLALLVTIGITVVPYLNYIFIPMLLEITIKQLIILGIIFILFIPWFGFLIYGLTGKNIFKKWN